MVRFDFIVEGYYRLKMDLWGNIMIPLSRHISYSFLLRKRNKTWHLGDNRSGNSVWLAGSQLHAFLKTKKKKSGSPRGTLPAQWWRADLMGDLCHCPCPLPHAPPRVPSRDRFQCPQRPCKSLAYKARTVLEPSSQLIILGQDLHGLSEGFYN